MSIRNRNKIIKNGKVEKFIEKFQSTKHWK